MLTLILFFLLDCFSHLIFWQWFLNNLDFMIFFIFLSAKLSWSHYLTDKFDRLTQVGSSLFLAYNCFFIIIIIILYIRFCFFSKISYILFIKDWASRFFQLGVFLSNYLNYKLNKLTYISFFLFFILFFIIWYFKKIL